ncbi:MAG TPA: NAD-dependent epimerase/dehydratase family protein, partial [Gemmatimonadaceae bacterium]|nr:NAD-dependent epimerase/dehydratase family protein [Gemmatimonadaceae bacterium]
MTSLFITGGTGFIGRHVLAQLRALPVDDVRCLVRREGTARGRAEWRSEWVEVVGDVGRPEQYAHSLPAGGAVVHLAAATGKRRPRELRRQNVDATASLVHAAEAAGAARLVFISSVAARFPDLARYPYGASKRDAERIVQEGRLPHAIIRPTMVFGAGSPNQRALERLALLPVPVMFGTGSVLVQPVAARDLARVIVGIATQGRTGETFEV